MQSWLEFDVIVRKDMKKNFITLSFSKTNFRGEISCTIIWFSVHGRFLETLKKTEMSLTPTGYMRTSTRYMRTIWKIGLGTPNHWALLIQRSGRLCNESVLRWIFHEHDALKEERFSKNVYSLNFFLDQQNLKKCKDCDVVNEKRHFFELCTQNLI